MGSYVDLDRLAGLVRNKRGGRGLREMAREIGSISPSTLSRVENGKMPDMETFLLLCDWLQIPPATFIQSAEASPAAAAGDPETIAIQLRASKDIDPEMAEALAAMVMAARRTREG